MNDGISYPTAAMDTVASEVHTEITNALPAHYQMINTITTLDGLFPGNVEEIFVGHIKSWAQNVEASYASLNTLAENLNLGSHQMAETDHNVSQGFPQ